MAGFKETLELDIAGALRSVGQVESRLTQVGQQFRVSLARSLDDLSGGFRLEITADTSALQASLDNAISDTTVQITADAAPVTGEIDAAVDRADATIQVAADAAPVTGEIDAAVDRADTTVQVTADAAPVTGEIDAAVDRADATVHVTADTTSITGEIDAAVDRADTTVQVTADTASVTGEIDAAVDRADTDVVVTADTAPAVASVQRFEDQIETTTTRAGRQFAGIFASAAIGAGLLRIRDAASNLQQSIGATEAVFGRAGGVIDEFAESAVESVALSERAVRELTSRLGASLKSFGLDAAEAAEASIFLTRTGADLAATYGGEVQTAVEALGAALRGEADPAEQFGLSLRITAVNAEAVRLGLAESANAVSDYAKVQATLSLITAQSGGALGQLARESGTAAVAQQRAGAAAEEAAAEFGESLLPVTVAVSDAVSVLARVFGALPEPVQTTVVALAGIAVVAGPITNVVGLVRSLTAASAASAVATAASTTAVTANAVALNSAAAVSNLYTGATLRARLANLSFAASFAGIAAVVAPLAVLSARNADIARGAEQAADAISDFVERGDFDPLVDDFAAFRAEIDRVNAAGQTLADEFDRTGIAEGQLRQRINAATEALNPYANQLDATAQQVIEYAEAEGVSTEEAYRRIQAQQTGTTATGEFNAANVALTDTVKLQTAAVERLREVEQARYDQARGQLDTQLGLQTALLDTSDALDAATEAQSEFGATSEEAQRAVIAATQAAVRQSDAAVAAAEQQNGIIQLSAQETARIQIEQLQSVADNLDPGSDLRRNLDEYIFSLANIPNEVQTRLFLDAFLNPNFGTDTEILLRGLQPRAGGGDIFAGQVYRFNEGGPGEVFIPAIDGTMLSREQAALAVSSPGAVGAGTTVVLNQNNDLRGTPPEQVLRLQTERAGFALARMLPP